MMFLKTDASGHPDQWLLEWPVNTMLVHASDGSLQVLPTAGDTPLLPMTSMVTPIKLCLDAITAMVVAGDYAGYFAALASQTYATSAVSAEAATRASADTTLQSGINAKLTTPTGSTAQYVRGDGTLAAFPTLGTASAQNVGAFDVSGAAASAQAASQPLTTIITNMAALSGTTGVPRKTGAATWTLDTSSFLTGNQTITLSGDVTGSGATTITTTLATVATPGTYSGVTVNAKGLVTAGTTLSFNNAASVAIQTVAAAANGAQVSATQAAMVSYTVPTSTTSTIGGASSVTVVLEICSTNSAVAANWTTISSVQNSQTVTLAVALQVVQVLQQVVAGVVPAGFFRRLRSIISGTGSSSTASGQEVLM